VCSVLEHGDADTQSGRIAKERRERHGLRLTVTVLDMKRNANKP
jgi:hypothetical protein